MPILADLVVEQTVEQRGQLLGGVLQRVDGGVRRQNLAQVSSATRRLFSIHILILFITTLHLQMIDKKHEPQYNGYCIQFECIEGLLCDVVIADVILQGQVEPVLLVDQIEARIRVHLVGVPQPPVAAALPTRHVSKDDVSRPGPTCPRTARTRGPRSAAPAAARSGPAHSRCGSATQTRPRVRGLW